MLIDLMYYLTTKRSLILSKGAITVLAQAPAIPPEIKLDERVVLPFVVCFATCLLS